MLTERLLPLNLQFFAEGGDGASDAGADAGADAGTDAGTDAGASGANADGADGSNNQGAGTDKGDNSTEALKAEIARLNAAMAKQKKALDDATHEAKESKQALKAKMTAEEIAAKEKEEAEAAQAQRIVELEKQVARAGAVKTVMGKLGLDEESAGSLADCLYGAADIENALLEIQKAWQLKETALRKEFGKVTGPGAGADSNSPEALAIKRASELGKEKRAINEQAQKAMSAYMR